MLIRVQKVRVKAILTGYLFFVKLGLELLLHWSHLRITCLTQTKQRCYKYIRQRCIYGHSFLVRQQGLVERESTQGLWSQADLVLKI